MHRFAKRLVVLATVIHIIPSAAFADLLVDGVPIPASLTVLTMLTLAAITVVPVFLSTRLGLPTYQQCAYDG